MKLRARFSHRWLRLPLVSGLAFLLFVVGDAGAKGRKRPARKGKHKAAVSAPMATAATTAAPSPVAATAGAVAATSGAKAASKAASPASPARPAADGKHLLDGVRQLVVVTAPAWDATSGELRRYERPAGSGKWQSVGASVDVALGAKGFAWGRGFYGSPPSAPVKTEEDDRSVAGAFGIGPVFGDGDFVATGLKIPFIPITTAIECVNDPGSPRYNRIVNRDTAKEIDWKGSEHMVRPDSIYRVGFMVQNNTDDPSPGAGSCVFVHASRSASTPTEGGTGVDRNVLADILGWLDGSKKPILVQLPEAEYMRVMADWDLPLDDGSEGPAGGVAGKAAAAARAAEEAAAAEVGSALGQSPDASAPIAAATAPAAAAGHAKKKIGKKARARRR